MAYDFTSGGQDATSTLIVSHLTQLKPYFLANADVLPYVKAGFIGAWGEWNSSQNGNSCGYNSGATLCSTANANRLIIRNALVASVHPLTAVQFRLPDDIVQWFPSALSQNGAFKGSIQSRTGLHSDCQLSDATDSGTWQNYNSGVAGSTLQTYADAATNYVPYGGELANGCGSTQRLLCSDARTDFARWHLAWLKDAGGDSNWRTSWASGGCTNELYNMTGYRLQLDDASHQSAAIRGQSITANIDLRNVGWSRVFSPRKVNLVLTNGGNTITCKSRIDLRALPPQATASSRITIPCVIPGGAATGTWSVFLSIPDIWPNTSGVAAFAIQPANANNGGQAWNGTTFQFSTGTTLSVN
jgi:hypothetical protein